VSLAGSRPGERDRGPLPVRGTHVPPRRDDRPKTDSPGHLREALLPPSASPGESEIETSRR